MAEKREIPVIEAPAVIDRLKSEGYDDFVETKIGFGKKPDTKYSIYFGVPKTDEQAESRYGVPLSYLISAGVRQLSTRVDYPSVMFDEDGNLLDGGHEAGQTLADGYQVGRKTKPETTEKKKALAMGKKLVAQGVTDEKLAKFLEMEAQGLLDD